MAILPLPPPARRVHHRRVLPSPVSVATILLALVVIGFTGCKPAHESRVAPSARQPAWFEDVTAKSGLRFVHDSGATGKYFMPESIGSGGALFDFDNDGRLDVYLVHCGGTNSPSRNQLFHQQPDGSFHDVSAGSGLDVNGHGMGVATGDVNNDGRCDVLLTEYGRARLFLNRGGGKFEDVTASSGIDNPRWGTSAAFFDYDRDGWLDLVIANYVDYASTQKCFDTRGAQEYCGPQGMPGTATRLFRNLAATNSPPRFTDETTFSGLARKIGPALGVVCADFTGDGWADIFVADDGQPNRLFVNQHNGTFVEEAAARGIAYTMLGGTAANMGVALGDVNGDGLFETFVTHLVWENHTLWQQGPRGVFQDRTAAAGLNAAAWRGTGFGTVMADFDLDGAHDLALVNGAIKRADHDPAPRLSGLAPFWSPYAQRNQLFAGNGQGSFRDVSSDNPSFSTHAAVGRALLCGDLDNDGALDLVATTAGGPVRIFRNTAPRRGHWLAVRALLPQRGGRDAYGAEIVVQSGPRRWWRLMQPGTGYLTSNDPRVHFGLGDATVFDSITVRWPDGAEESFPAGKADQLLVLSQGSGRTK